jgi:hypothetical protein
MGGGIGGGGARIEAEPIRAKDQKLKSPDEVTKVAARFAPGRRETTRADSLGDRGRRRLPVHPAHDRGRSRYGERRLADCASLCNRTSRGGTGLLWPGTPTVYHRTNVGDAALLIELPSLDTAVTVAM